MSSVSSLSTAPPAMTTSTPLFVSSFAGTSSTFASSTPTSSSSSEPSLTSSAALYLYTFLATLVLLLAVSSAIVIRSLILRRRHQRIVEEAIRAGTWLPHQAYDPRSSRRRRDIGKKPKMWEAWLRSGDHGGGDGKCAWNDIMPINAAYANTSPQCPAEESAQTQSDVQSRTMRFLRPFHRPSPSLTSPSVASTPAPSSPSRSASPPVRVAVLVAMPVPPQQRPREGDGPPAVELGVVELPLQNTYPTEQP